MKIFWETPFHAGSSISPSNITCMTWMPHCPPKSIGNSTPPHINSFIGNTPSETRGFLAVGSETGVLGITGKLS